MNRTDFFLGRRNVAKHRTDGSAEAGSLLARLQVRAAATGHSQQLEPAGQLVPKVELFEQHFAAAA